MKTSKGISTKIKKQGWKSASGQTDPLLEILYQVQDARCKTAVVGQALHHSMGLVESRQLLRQQMDKSKQGLNISTSLLLNSQPALDS
ncbi:hypothetical protein J6590_058188 [Homalodisca vitripennis]|nr:hypothetical protein J6590_058184 [Homalodisca vitripennis]KAG8301193.1 hypothetical protein J6590_058188 [Homalodisca vitripennis]